ncbi:hypothetical protein HOLleu_42110 [Holothuria leucospilota]|uniref:DUF4218 domain-containing protein n=1 Tax=Holothuria leucospilota TaxID=206669 RepID=A0A9Q0YFS9_HOLLE|nr:hypothetical protein HOLleu_42110 [Holothuria leucospilota]
MNPAYFDHYCLLVESIYTLSMDSVSLDDIEKCGNLLKQYCFMFQVLYGEKHMSANLHLLLHLATCVTNHGPLWVYSCFKFEDHNGQLLKWFHGAKNPELQIRSKLQMIINMPRILSKFRVTSSKNVQVQDYMKHISHSYSLPNGVEISKNVHVLGSIKLVSPTLSVMNNICTELGYIPSKCFMFFRLSLYGSVIHSKEYSSSIKRNSYTVFYHVQSNRLVGQIESYVKCCACDLGKDCDYNCKAQYLARISRLPYQQASVLHDSVSDARLSHLVVVSNTLSREHFVPISQIESLGVYMDFSDVPHVSYISDTPDLVEYD